MNRTIPSGLGIVTRIFILSWVISVAMADCGTGDVVKQRYRVVERYPHDSQAFTEGLVFHRDTLYESTGLVGQSTVRKVQLTTGRVISLRGLDDGLFGEGLTVVNDRLVQLTWRSGWALIRHPGSLRQLDRLHYFGEGWGITTVGTSLVMSNGSDKLVWLNPQNLSIEKTLRIQDQGRALEGLNELEYVRGKILANVWPSACIAIIDPGNGQVTGWFDLSRLYPETSTQDHSNVANGVAYDRKRNRLFVTGKGWPYLYELEIY